MTHDEEKKQELANRLQELANRFKVEELRERVEFAIGLDMEDVTISWK